MNIVVVGTGYVGLVGGTCFAETGNNVTCVDIDASKVEKLNNKICTIYEPGLEVLLKRNVEQGRLKFTTDLASVVDDAEIIFLALPTPPGGDGSADLKYVLGVADDLGKMIKDYKVIVNKSTVPVGTADKVQAAISKNTDIAFDVVSNPEFLREGVAVTDFLKPERVVIGTKSEKARNLIKELYEPYVRQGNPIIFMDERSAELTKYAANSFLATKISFMNEIANLCEIVGANVDMVRSGIGSDARIGNKFLYAGVGYGGSCFPKDVQALYQTATEYNYNFKILDAVMNVNSLQKERFFDRISSYFKGDLKGKTVALWGLSFKPNTDDIREAPALYIIDKLLEAGAKVKAFDPEAMENVEAIYDDKVTFCKNQYEATEGADFIVIVTEWLVFRDPDFDKLKENLSTPLIFDGRNLYDLTRMQDKGFSYFSIGRKDI
ncbi:MAG: UDP-glucose dehydrogenase family protein [Chitinophagales bacterium]